MNGLSLRVNYCKVMDKIEEDEGSGHDLGKCGRGVEWDEKDDTMHCIDEWN